MTQDEFIILVDTYGANTQRWPEDSRSEALAFVENHADIANPLLLEAKKLDEALDAVKITPGTDMLKARILQAVNELPSNQPAQAATQPTSGLKYRAVAAMMAISFVLGFAGANILQSENTDTNGTFMVDNEWEELAGEYGMSDVYEWVGQDALP